MVRTEFKKKEVERIYQVEEKPVQRNLGCSAQLTMALPCSKPFHDSRPQDYEKTV